MTGKRRRAKKHMINVNLTEIQETEMSSDGSGKRRNVKVKVSVSNPAGRARSKKAVVKVTKKPVASKRK